MKIHYCDRCGAEAAFEVTVEVNGGRTVYDLCRECFDRVSRAFQPDPDAMGFKLRMARSR